MPAPHVPTDKSREQVKAMVAYGLTQVEVATVMDMTDKTLRKHYWRELETGSILAIGKVAESLYNKALGSGPGSVTACIFWLKARGGWQETLQVSLPEEALGKLDVENMSRETLMEIANAQLTDSDTEDDFHREIH